MQWKMMPAIDVTTPTVFSHFEAITRFVELLQRIPLLEACEVAQSPIQQRTQHCDF